MNKNIRQILFFSLIIIFICFIGVLILTLPSLLDNLNFSNNSTSNIGSTIGGITAPFIGIISSILLYLALTRQTQSNFDQRLKNESDLIFLLLNQLDNEISTFYYTYGVTQGSDRKEFSYYGIQAFHIFIQNLNINSTLSNFKHTFKSFYQASQIILIIRSFLLIEKRIQISDLSPELKSMFLDKLASVYQCRLENSLKILNDLIDENPHVKDNSTDEIKSFINGRQFR